MAHDIRPIHTEAEYDEAMHDIEELWDNHDEEVQNRLEVLTILVEAYEKEHHALPDPDPIEALRFHMEQRGLTNQDLTPYIGTRSRVFEVLHKRRPLTLNMIRALHYSLGIPAEALLGPVKLTEPTRGRKHKKQQTIAK